MKINPVIKLTIIFLGHETARFQECRRIQKAVADSECVTPAFLLVLCNKVSVLEEVCPLMKNHQNYWSCIHGSADPAKDESPLDRLKDRSWRKGYDIQGDFNHRDK